MLLLHHHLDIVLHVNYLIPACSWVVVVQNHFGLQWLIDYMSVTTWSTSANVHRRSRLPVACHLLVMLEATGITSGHHRVWLLMRIGHIVMLFLTDCLSTVRSDWSSWVAVDHSASVASIRKWVVARSLVVHSFVLRRLEAAVNALGHYLVERASHLFLRLVVVNHALSVGLARSPEVVLVVSAVTCRALGGKHRVLETVMVGDRLHEVVVLRWKVVAHVRRGLSLLHTAWLLLWALIDGLLMLLGLFNLLSDLLHATLRRGSDVCPVGSVDGLHVLGNNFILALLPVEECCVGRSRCNWMLLISIWEIISDRALYVMLISCWSRAWLFIVDCWSRGSCRNIFAIKAIGELLLVVLGCHVHIVQTDLALVRFDCSNVVCVQMPVLNWARQVLGLLFRNLWWVCIETMASCWCVAMVNHTLSFMMLALGNNSIVATLNCVLIQLRLLPIVVEVILW